MAVLTTEQREAVNSKNHATVAACPGSGKTRCIVAKLIRCAEEVRETPRKVACITYTNVAANEIYRRLQRSGSNGDDELCDVSTIHSFCQNSVLRHFHWKIPELENGYRVLAPEVDLFKEYVDVVADRHQLSDFAKRSFSSLSRLPDGSPVVSGGITEEAAVEFWHTLLNDGYLDFSGLVFYAYRILCEYGSLRQNIAARYAHLLIDEFQDTTALQCELFKLIFAEGLTKFFLVGDEEQSIYSFAGANRELMSEFTTYVEGKRFPLSGNFRSSKNIVDAAQRVIQREPPMHSVGDWKDCAEQPTIVEGDGDFEVVTDYFLPKIDELNVPFGETAILAPNWFKLLPIGKQLRDYGIPVVGPGARPYRRSNMFSDLTEQICAQVDQNDPALIRNAERALFQLVENLTGKPNLSIFSFNGRRVLYRLIEVGGSLAEKHENVSGWLTEAAEAFRSILSEEGLLGNKSGAFLRIAARDMLRDMERNNTDPDNMELGALGMFANPRGSMKLLTFHGAKGREFSAVLMIAANDGLIPYYNYYNPLSNEGEEEGRRLFYVAVTRAKRILYISTGDDSKPPSRYISELGLNA